MKPLGSLTETVKLLQKQLPKFRTKNPEITDGLQISARKFYDALTQIKLPESKPLNKQQTLIAAEQRINELYLLLGLGNKAKLTKDDFTKEHIAALNKELEGLKSSNQQYNPEAAKKREARRQELEVLMPLISRLKDGNGQLTHGQSAQINQLEREKAVTWSRELQELLFPKPLDNKLPSQSSTREEVDAGKDGKSAVSFPDLFCGVLEKIGNPLSTVGLGGAALALATLMSGNPAIRNSIEPIREGSKPISDNNSSVFHPPNKYFHSPNK